MNKKGQWTHAMARERRSQERRERLEATKDLLKKGLSANEIALKLGVSGNTINQYINEVGHLIKEEENWEDLAKKSNKLSEEIENLRMEGSDDPEKMKIFVDKCIQFFNVFLKQIESCEKRNINSQKLKGDMIVIIRSLYSTLFCSTMHSLKVTFNNPSNRKSISENEIGMFNEMFKKWDKKIHSGIGIAKKDYVNFIEELKTYDCKSKGKIKIIKILENVEKAFGLNKNLKKVNKEVEIILNKLGLDKELIEKSNKGNFVNKIKSWFYR